MILVTTTTELLRSVWKERGGLLGPQDATVALADPDCFDTFLKSRRSMSLSETGNILAIGYESYGDSTGRCYYLGTGVVEVFKIDFLEAKWKLRGNIVSNKDSRTSLSANGNIGHHQGLELCTLFSMTMPLRIGCQWEKSLIYLMTQIQEQDGTLDIGSNIWKWIAIGHPGKDIIRTTT